ncbi:MAG: hypothetical protein RL417_2167 [Pseudomonadota bacterium]
MTLPKWAPEDPSGKLRSGIDSRIVIAAVLGFVVLSVAFISLTWSEWLAGAPSAASEVEEPAALSPSPPKSSDDVESPTSQSGEDSRFLTAEPPEVRGYVVFGGRTFIVTTAEAHLSKDRNKVAVLLQTAEPQPSPPLSFVFELVPNTTRCTLSSLARYRIIVTIPLPQTPLNVRLSRIPDSSGVFSELEDFNCTREIGGNLEFGLVGTDEETADRTGSLFNYAVSVKTILKEYGR